MKPKITNNCKKIYRLKAEELTEQIINKIPEKFLDGLKEVSLIDSGKGGDSINRYIPRNRNSNYSKIEIDLDNKIFKIPYISTLSLNIFLLLSINQHIDRYLRNKTEDPDILSFNSSKVNYNWMYFGIWKPMLVFNRFFQQVIGGRGLFKSILKWWTNVVTKKKSEKDEEVV
jgi:hypothetical protein